jgi:hypothetical protein
MATDCSANGTLSAGTITGRVAFQGSSVSPETKTTSAATERGTVSGVLATNARRAPPLLASKAANCVEKITLSWSAVAVQLQCRQ